MITGLQQERGATFGHVDARGYWACNHGVTTKRHRVSCQVEPLAYRRPRVSTSVKHSLYVHVTYTYTGILMHQHLLVRHSDSLGVRLSRPTIWPRTRARARTRTHETHTTWAIHLVSKAAVPACSVLGSAVPSTKAGKNNRACKNILPHAMYECIGWRAGERERGLERQRERGREGGSEDHALLWRDFEIQVTKCSCSSA